MEDWPHYPAPLVLNKAQIEAMKHILEPCCYVEWKDLPVTPPQNGRLD